MEDMTLEVDGKSLIFLQVATLPVIGVACVRDIPPLMPAEKTYEKSSSTAKQVDEPMTMSQWYCKQR